MQVTITIDTDEDGKWVITSPDVPILRVVDRDQMDAVLRITRALEAILDANDGRMPSDEDMEATLRLWGNFASGGGGRPIR